ncbi:MAG: hypothetical protein WCZ66_03305 [Sphingomonadaceae bacterium]
MQTDRIETTLARSCRPVAGAGGGLAQWWRDISASHSVYVAERAQRRRRKRELMPVTPFQLWFYRLAFSGLGLTYAWLLMERLS